MKGRVLIVAGSDSGGGAGIQADIKTVTALGGFAATAVTALTAQNTRGVFDVLAVPPSFVASQMRLVLEDIGADAIKTGMLHDAGVIDAVADALEALAPRVPLVLDPVIAASGGTSLLEPTALAALKRRLIVRAAMLTPNVPEAEALSGMAIRSLPEMRAAAEALLTLGPRAVLLKGGHLASAKATDVLATEHGLEVFEDDWIDTPHTHGTGCTLASAIAVSLAQGMDVTASVKRARAYLRRAIATAPGFGSGQGPLNHAHPCER